MGKNVIIVGGGIAGLAASIYLARGGRTVTLFEREHRLGGRSTTQLHSGFRFNLGPHRVLRRGAAARVFRELGVPLRGGRPRAGGTALLAGKRFRLPVSPLSLTFTGLLGGRAKVHAASLLFRIRRINVAPYARMTLREWLDANVSDARLRLTFETLVRASTFSSDPDQSAALALQQLRLANSGFVYIDEGWQKIVDSLHSHAVSAGVNFVTSSQVLRVIHEGSVRAIELGGLEEEERGTQLAAETVILAVDPVTAGQLVGDAEFARTWSSLRPVTAACLDVALSRLPDRKHPVVAAIDRPLYLSVHSAFAQLTPHGGALLHAVKFEGGSDNAEEELEAFLDEMQPGWRDLVVYRRFLPSAMVSNALVTPRTPRPWPVTPVPGLYLAGDWVDAEGLLADAAVSSAKQAAEAILRSP